MYVLGLPWNSLLRSKKRTSLFIRTVANILKKRLIRFLLKFDCHSRDSFCPFNFVSFNLLHLILLLLLLLTIIIYWISIF